MGFYLEKKDTQSRLPKPKSIPKRTEIEKQENVYEGSGIENSFETITLESPAVKKKRGKIEKIHEGEPTTIKEKLATFINFKFK